jgi:hypothetical protein
MGRNLRLDVRSKTIWTWSVYFSSHEAMPSTTGLRGNLNSREDTVNTVKAGLIFFAVGMMPFLSVAQEGDDYGPQPNQQKEVKKLDEKNAKLYKGNKDILLLPGIMADRKKKRVEILTESTGLAAEDAVEFMIVHHTSAQGYESLLWAHAKPSDIHKALEFIGVPGGTPRNPMGLRFWAKGELIKASVRFDKGEEISLEEMIFDKDADQAMEDQDFMFTGSLKFPDPKDKTKTIYLADKYQPKAILPGFNSPVGVLEPMWTASKGEAYQTHVVNPDYALDAHKLQTLILEPKQKDGKKRVLDLNMTVENSRTFRIADAKGKQLTDDTSVKAALTVCLDYLKKGQLPYVTLRFSEKLKLFEIRQLCGAMAMLDQPNALRIEPPAPGRLYYRSFLTSPAWRDQTKRMSQCWEVHATRKDKGLTSTMVFYDTIWPEGSSKPEYKKRTFPAPTAKSIRERLDLDEKERQKANESPAPLTLMVFCPADLDYGQLLKFLGPALKTHRTVHLFLEGPGPQLPPAGNQ